MICHVFSQCNQCNFTPNKPINQTSDKIFLQVTQSNIRQVSAFLASTFDNPFSFDICKYCSVLPQHLKNPFFLDICQSYSVLPRSLENISIVPLLFGNLFLTSWHLQIFFFLAYKLGNHILSPFWHFVNFTWSSLFSSIWQSLHLSYDIGNHIFSCNSNWPSYLFSLLCKFAISFCNSERLFRFG